MSLFFKKKKRKKAFSLLEARGYVGNLQGCPSGGRVTAQQLSTGAAYPQPYLNVSVSETQHTRDAAGTLKCKSA
jgi:hypothetical protein